MHDTGGVSGGQRGGDLAADVQRLFDGHRLFGHEVAQRKAVDEFRGDKVGVVF